jgi:coenzyme F420-0:L-glutamate ligase/coenzyme F420-1:gamma-L-glutamate ligase
LTAVFNPQFIGFITFMSAAQSGLQIIPLTRIPMVEANDNLGSMVIGAMRQQGLEFANNDVLVIAQKVVSKAENRVIRLDGIQASERASKLAREVGKDERLVELILRESTAVVRSAPGVIIVRHKLGLVCANAGIDQSNIDHKDGPCALLLPEDPDASAVRLRSELEAATGKRLAVVICDSVNRPWRLGSIAMAIGSAGIAPLNDQCGQVDTFGRTLAVTMSNVVDSVATAASLVMGEATERIPAVIVRGLSVSDSKQNSADCVRPTDDDLFL